MRLTYTQIKNHHLRMINQASSTDTNIVNDFNTNLGQRYQLMLAKLADYRTTHESTFQTGMQVALVSTGVQQTISTITSVTTTATVTTSAAHGYSTGNSVIISGVSPTGYNGVYTITVTSTTVFTYTLANSLAGVAGTTSQYYPMPQGEVTIDGMYITIGSVNYPLQIINSRWDWEQLNAIQIQASAIPQFYFPRVDDFGIWPIPQAVYTGNISYHFRDRNISVADYTSGTVSTTQYSNQIIGGNPATFTSAMVGRWFTITDGTVPGQGLWSRITSFTDSTHINLYNTWNTASASTISSYIIGETPELPEETHILLAYGTVADFYIGMRKDLTNGNLYNNLFWTGDPSNNSRREGDKTVAGGLIGAMSRYTDRDNTRIIKRKPRLNPLQYKTFATTLS